MPAAQVQLEEIVDALQMQFDEVSNWLDTETGQVHAITDWVKHRAEEGGPFDDLPEWQRPEAEAAYLIQTTDRFLPLPDQYDIHEWAIMQDFIGTIRRSTVRDDLARATHGGGAFRRFKAAAARHHLLDSWFSFRDAAMRQIAIDWCEENGIPYRTK